MAARRSPLPLVLALFAVIGALGVAAWLISDDGEPPPDGGGAPVVTTDPERGRPALELPEPVDQGPAPTPAEPPPPREGGIQGRIVDENRVPVREAVVSLHRGSPINLPGVRDLPSLGLSVPVDPSGAFAFADVPAGELIVVRVSGGAFETTDSGPHSVLMGQVTDVGRIVVEPGVRIAGVVIGPGGRPVPGAEVALGFGIIPMVGEPDPEPERLVRCDDDGRFLIEHAPRTMFQLVARADGFTRGAFSQSSAILDDVTVIEATIQLGEAARLEGQVVSGLDGTPVPGIEVRMIPRGTASAWYERTLSDDEGRFAFDDVLRGLARIDADGHGWIPARVDADASAFDSGVVVTLDPAGAIEGRVVDGEGRPIAAFDLQTHASNKRGILGVPQGVVRVRDRDGRFRVDDLDPSHYVFEVWAKGHAVSLSRPVLVKPGQTVRGVELTMQVSATLAGRVVDDLGAPIAAAEVSMHTNLTPRAGFLRESAGRASWYQRTRTDDEGRFELRNVTEQDYQLEVDHIDYPKAFLDDIVAQAGKRTDVGDIVLPRPATVTGAVLDGSGQKVIGATVTLGGGVSRQTSRETRTDGQGRYRFDRLEPGEYQVICLSTQANPLNHLTTMLAQIERDEQGRPVLVPDVVVGPGEVREHTVVVDR